MVSLSYGYAGGFMNDGDDVSAWDQEHLSGIDAADASIADYLGDYARISAVLDSGSADDEYVYYDMSSTLNFSSATTGYNKYRIRYRTSESSAGLAARVVLHWGDGHTENILGGTAGVFSTTFTVAQGSITYVASYVDNIQVYGIENGNGSGTDTVDYDFIQIYKGDFTLPNVAEGMTIDFRPRDSLLFVPSRDTDIIQHLGSESAEVTLTCDLTQGDWTRTGDHADGEAFLEMMHNRSSEPWQWLDTGTHQFKVGVHPRFKWVDSGDTTTRLVDLTLREYSLGDKSNESYYERWGLDL